MNLSDHWRLPVPRRRYLAVAQRLLTAIQDGTYTSGDRLPSEREIAEQMGVSRPTAREATLALELAGVITVRHGDGTYISNMHDSYIDRGLDFGASPRELMEARITVEPPVCGLLTRTVDEASLQPIQQELDIAAGLIDDLASLPDFVDMSMRFHAMLASLCDNHILNNVVSELLDVGSQPLWALINQMVLKDRKERVTVIEEHQGVLDRVRAGDPEAAETAMRTHLHANRRQVFMEDTIAGPLEPKETELTGEVLPLAASSPSARAAARNEPSRRHQGAARVTRESSSKGNYANGTDEHVRHRRE